MHNNMYSFIELSNDVSCCLSMFRYFKLHFFIYPSDLYVSLLLTSQLTAFFLFGACSHLFVLVTIISRLLLWGLVGGGEIIEISKVASFRKCLHLQCASPTPELQACVCVCVLLLVPVSTCVYACMCN